MSEPTSEYDEETDGPDESEEDDEYEDEADEDEEVSSFDAEEEASAKVLEVLKWARGVLDG